MPKPFSWKYIDEQGSFRVENPDHTGRLYFPLANEAGLLSSITPDLHGDIKTSHNSFLTLPVSIEDIHDSKSSRNFWVHAEGHSPWSVTGVSARQIAEKAAGKRSEKSSLEAGLLWHTVTRINETLGLKATLTNFVPIGPDTLEIMLVSLTNTGRSTVKITPTSAIPIFGRSADNLRDHFHVTSLLNRHLVHPAGVVVKPTMSFDERGHKINGLYYAVLGVNAHGEYPEGVFPTLDEFIGEGGNLEAPLSVTRNNATPRKLDPSHQGKSAIGAIRFKKVGLAPRETTHYVLLLGITEKESKLNEWLKKYGSHSKALQALKDNKTFWAEKVGATQFLTQSTDYNRWMRWVVLQPTLRKLFGCSFLPDFDYGRGGRGWRDLWQDCLALLLTSPEETKPLLLHNFQGIRIDGSNATIIGQEKGEFIADRNNLTRVWMDHGVWPYLTLELYLHQTGDAGILFQNTTYFRDQQLHRAKTKDPEWGDRPAGVLTTQRGKKIKGTVLEHLLVQHLVQFYNVGQHNHIRLENADWNDGLDMAHEKGESVAFTCLYAANLKKLADLLEHVAERKSVKKVVLQKELLLLLDRVTGRKINYNQARLKTKRLELYFKKVQPFASGKTASVPIKKLIRDLREKSAFIFRYVRQKEWLQTRNGDGFFNGYYDNHGRRVEGESSKGLRMTLAGQVFPVMSGVANQEQVKTTYRTIKKYLRDKEHGGFRLNTDFGEIRPDLGRAFSFAYGDKENGAFFNHMNVMLAYALYQRNFVEEGREVLESIYRMACRTEKSKIFPGIPEYFNSEGRGLYHYLTGSASWYLLTLLTQVFGVKGKCGDLLLAPKFTANDFSHTKEVSVITSFAGYKIKVTYRNPKKISYQYYCAAGVSINGHLLKELKLNDREVLIPKRLLLKYLRKKTNQIVVSLE